MKILSAAMIGLLVWACGNQKHLTIEPTEPREQIKAECRDTTGTVYFINSKSVEIRLNLSSKSVTWEGTTKVNVWKNFSVKPIKPGDTLLHTLKANQEFMYSIYGPVSTNVTGMGVVAEAKFTLSACEKRQIVY